MAKADASKKTAKPNKKDQYERFQKTARDLSVDNEENAVEFEKSFAKIVPPKAKLGRG
jgi:hypothetical protein